MRHWPAPPGQGLDGDTLDHTAREIIAVREMGVDVVRRRRRRQLLARPQGAMTGMDATQSDHIGMLGTVMNALALQDALERHGQDTRVQSAIEMPRIAEPYIRRRAMRHLEKGRVVIFAAGTGNPFFTTDTAAALRAAEIDADALLKGTHSGVDGVYAPTRARTRRRSSTTRSSYIDVMTKDLKVMDATAIAFCRDNKIPIVVFDMSSPGALQAILRANRWAPSIHRRVCSAAASRCTPCRMRHADAHGSVRWRA